MYKQAMFWQKKSFNEFSRSVEQDYSSREGLPGISQFSGCLSLYHTIPTFNDREEKTFGKHYGKRRKCWSPAFSPFPIMFSTLP